MDTADPTGAPVASRSVRVTTFELVPGLTSATPRLRLIDGMTSTKRDPSVIDGIGVTPACACTNPLLTIPNVTVGDGSVEIASGVMITYPDRIEPCSTTPMGCGAVGDEPG